MGLIINPATTMVAVQVAFVAVNVFYKLAANDGMSLSVVVTYRFIFATAFILPVALFLERYATYVKYNIVLVSVTFLF